MLSIVEDVYLPHTFVGLLLQNTGMYLYLYLHALQQTKRTDS